MKITQFLNILKSTRSPIDLRHIEYDRIGKKADIKEAELTETESNKIAEAVTDATNVQEMTKALNMGEQLIASKQVKFEWAQDRHSISSVVGNETRANLSIKVSIPGTVELPETRPEGLPRVFGTSTWRNYCVVRDGALNISKLPVQLTKEAHTALVGAGHKIGPWLQGHIYEIDLAQFELTDKVKLDLSEFAGTVFTEVEEKASKKVYKHFLDALKGPEKSKTLTELYGQEAAEWLKTIGITDQGWAPATETGGTTETYKAEELSVKVKGFAVPSVNALQKKLDASKKLNAGEQYLKKTMDTVRKELDAMSDDQKRIEHLEKLMSSTKTVLDELAEKLTDYQMAIIGKGLWFEGLTKGETAVARMQDATIEVSVVNATIEK